MKSQVVANGQGAWAGIDVAKKSCDVVRDDDAEPRAYGRSRPELKALVRWRQQEPIASIAVEARG